MIEFIKEFPWVAFIGACTTFIAAITSMIISIINAKNLGTVERHLDKAKKRGTYVVCPKCKKEIPLKDLDLRLPGGALDNNLNGIDDLTE